MGKSKTADGEENAKVFSRNVVLAPRPGFGSLRSFPIREIRVIRGFTSQLLRRHLAEREAERLFQVSEGRVDDREDHRTVGGGAEV